MFQNDGTPLRVGDIGMYHGVRYKITLSKSRGIELYLLDEDEAEAEQIVHYRNISFDAFKKVGLDYE